MYYVAGSNLFGQWLGDKNVINNFLQVFGDNDSFKIKSHAELVGVAWSYNILKSDNKYYVLGMWEGMEKQCKEINFPDGEVRLISDDLVVSGNDYYIIFVNKVSGNIDVLDLESAKWKKINLRAEIPTETKPKKAKHEDIFKVVVSNDTILYLTDDGSVYSGLLPTYIDTSHCEGKIIDVKCGYEHNLLLTNLGFVYSWGNGRRLQLGHQGLDNLESPTLIEALAGIKIKKIAAGGWHSLALSETGDLYAWGWNNNGQLGILDKNTESEPLKTYAVPTLVDFFSADGEEINIDVKDMACGSKHSVALLNDGSVWVTGNNSYGQLGLSEESSPLQYDRLIDKPLLVDHFKQCTALDHDLNVKKLKCGQWSTILIIHNHSFDSNFS